MKDLKKRNKRQNERRKNEEWGDETKDKKTQERIKTRRNKRFDIKEKLKESKEQRILVMGESDSKIYLTFSRVDLHLSRTNQTSIYSENRVAHYNFNQMILEQTHISNLNSQSYK